MMKIDEATSANIQVFRGLAIIAVVFIHNTPLGLPQVFVRPFLNFSVGMFLFLSGLLSSADRWNPKKRIAKVAIPYLVWSLVYVALFNDTSPLDTLMLYARCLPTGGASAIMYYVFVYCELTLLIPLIDRAARSRYKYLPLAIAPVEIVAMRLMPRVLGCSVDANVQVLMGVSCLGWFGYFYLGYLLGNKLLAVNASRLRLLMLLALAVLIEFAEGYCYYSMGETNCGTQMKLSSVLTGTMLMLVVYRYLEGGKACKAKWLASLGNLSFGIYFSHIVVMWLLAKLPFYGQIFYPVNAVIAVLASYACVWLGHRLLGPFARYMAW